MKESIEEKAAYFFTCKKDGFTKTQELEFQIWIKENIEHKKAFEKVEMLQSLYLSLPSDIKSKISQEVHRNIKSRNSLRKSNFLKFAASVIFIIGASLFGINEYMNFGIKHTYTSNQEIKNIVLPDGSKVILDAKTKLDIKYYILSSGIRETDLLARWGGEEFIIALIDSSLENSKIVCENLRKAIEEDIELMEICSFNVTASFGLTMVKKLETKESALIRVDEAMYKSKNSGKNKITIL